eukprot:59043-Amphidinium_carterae.2
MHQGQAVDESVLMRNKDVHTGLLVDRCGVHRDSIRPVVQDISWSPCCSCLTRCSGHGCTYCCAISEQQLMTGGAGGSQR